MQFDAVQFSLTHALRSTGEQLNDLVNLLLIHSLGAKTIKVVPTVGNSEGQCPLVFDAADVLLPARVRQLPYEFTIVVAPNTLANRFPELDSFITVDHCVIRQHPAARYYRYVG